MNFLARADRKILERFFKATPAVGDRFGDVAYSAKRTGAPVLDKAVGYLECEVRHIYEPNDHAIVVGEVVEAEVLSDDAPLVMQDTPWHYGG